MELHVCGTSKCPSCGKYEIPSKHRCFLKISEPKKPSEDFIFFDFETDQTGGEHKVNFAIAQYADGREQVFDGYSACENFCFWLFTKEHKGYTAVAHNMQG